MWNKFQSSLHTNMSPATVHIVWISRVIPKITKELVFNWKDTQAISWERLANLLSPSDCILPPQRCLSRLLRKQFLYCHGAAAKPEKVLIQHLQPISYDNLPICRLAPRINRLQKVRIIQFQPIKWAPSIIKSFSFGSLVHTRGGGVLQRRHQTGILRG